MSQSEKSFNVSDRRHFTAEGRPREEDAGADKDQLRKPTASALDPGAPAADPPPYGGPSTGGEPPPYGGPSTGGGPPADFSRFLLGLAAEAGRLLAGEGVPEGMTRADVLAGARQIVAILEMLKVKTEGRRTADEEALLAELLFQLRMAYVERTRAVEP
jgi:hypothetical protein